MRKHLAAFRIFNYAQGCRKKLLSVDIPLGVHRPLGVPTPVYCDNEAAVQVINSSKTKDSFLRSCLREFWLEVSTTLA